MPGLSISEQPLVTIATANPQIMRKSGEISTGARYITVEYKQKPDKTPRNLGTFRAGLLRMGELPFTSYEQGDEDFSPQRTDTSLPANILFNRHDGTPSLTAQVYYDGSNPPVLKLAHIDNEKDPRVFEYLLVDDKGELVWVKVDPNKQSQVTTLSYEKGLKANRIVGIRSDSNTFILEISQENDAAPYDNLNPIATQDIALTIKRVEVDGIIKKI